MFCDLEQKELVKKVKETDDGKTAFKDMDTNGDSL